jgi:hypothetical protein
MPCDSVANKIFRVLFGDTEADCAVTTLLGKEWLGSTVKGATLANYPTRALLGVLRKTVGKRILEI